MAMVISEKMLRGNSTWAIGLRQVFFDVAQYLDQFLVSSDDNLSHRRQNDIEFKGG